MTTQEKVFKSMRILIEGESSRSNDDKQSNVMICMVPDSLRKLNPHAYTPRIASIGPLHKEDEHLRAMEEHKVTYMCRLFHRTVNVPKNDMQKVTRKCVQAILGLVTRIRACYIPSFTNYDDSKFAEMIVIDGCFILELLLMFKYRSGEKDAIFDNLLVIHDMKSDFLLFENQIPFFILEVLFRLTVKRISEFYYLNHSLTDLIFYFLKDVNIINTSDFTPTDEDVRHCHILGLFHSCYKPKPRPSGPLPTRTYSATKLAVAGVKVKANKVKANKVRAKDSLLAVKFTFGSGLFNLLARKTCLEIPVLSIKNSTPSLLRNLIAYEQCYPLSCHYITSFAFLMDRLIDTTDDVSLLVRYKVLQHNLGASEDVTNLFNSICKGVVLPEFYYANEWKQLGEYCNKFLPSLLISMRGLYESTTWKTLTVIAAVMIFILTLLQTIYTIRNS